MLVTAVYKHKQSAELAFQKACGVRDGASEFMAEEPIVLEGKFACRYIDDRVEHRPVMPRYARHIVVAYDPSKFREMLSNMDNQTDIYKSIDVLRADTSNATIRF